MNDVKNNPSELKITKLMEKLEQYKAKAQQLNEVSRQSAGSRYGEDGAVETLSNELTKLRIEIKSLRQSLADDKGSIMVKDGKVSLGVRVSGILWRNDKPEVWQYEIVGSNNDPVLEDLEWPRLSFKSLHGKAIAGLEVGKAFEYIDNDGNQVAGTIDGIYYRKNSKSKSTNKGQRVLKRNKARIEQAC